MVDLTICQTCCIYPATYGDGLTWSRCALCQLKKLKKAQVGGSQDVAVQSPVVPKPVEHVVQKELVSIILPVYMTNYTLFHYTGNCIGSIREHTPEGSFELVVVDNGSPVPPPQLQSYYAQKVIKNEANLGVTKAWNQGIRMSVGEYIVLVNNDVQVFDGWLEGMLDGLAEGNDLVMAHPMYSLTEPFARAVEARKVLAGEKKLDPLERDFSCVMFRRSLIEEIGLFDEIFFSYCSDSDFFKRMLEKGKKYKMLDRVAVSHISDATGFSMSETPEIMNKDKAAYEEKWSKKEVVPQQAEPQKDGNLVRTKETGDAIYYIVGDKYHHVANPETLSALGFTFGDETVISLNELYKRAKYGEEINLKNVAQYAKTKV